jgi:hypothetical protein
MMKKKYQRPVTRELLLTKAVPLVAASPFRIEDLIPSGEVDPTTEVETGLSRDFDLDAYFDE